MTETTPKCDGYTYIYTYIHTYKRKPNAIHDCLPRAKALGNNMLVYIAMIHKCTVGVQSVKTIMIILLVNTLPQSQPTLRLHPHKQ